MTGKQLDKVYEPKAVEGKWYRYWLDHELFHADAGSPKKKYTIMIPPPNVTGMLTMGHILNNTIQDLLVRWKRMEGYEALWLPGTDHAGIATQNKVESALREEGITRHDLGREKLIEKVWEWKERYGGIILKQLRKLGASCDWKRERFTMDEGLSRAVKEVFIRLYEKDLIYKGRRLINWCPRCHTALANEEAPNIDIQGKFWHIAYPIHNSKEMIVVSTTRPETMLGDTAVAVHPEDERYQRWIGKHVMLPLMNRPIPIIADAHADPEKGSGAVKITPAHDFNDFEVGQRHQLEQISVIDENGKMNEQAGPYQGMDRFQARKQILKDLKELDLLKGEEPHQVPIPHCYRCKTIIEPMLSEQWFVKMKPLADPAIRAVKEGKIRFYPKQWEETYFYWMENIRDWCISRQIWWGHRIPVWTCINGHRFTAREDPDSCPKCGNTQLQQDPDVLDTWFSSWLWPFSTLGWPVETEDLKSFFPTDTMVTGPDIIFFWVARMIMASLEFMGEVPFHDVYFNGMIRDLSGKTMSKSLGNSPDPLWLIDGASRETVKDFALKNPSYKEGVPPYGADAIRLTMVYLTPLGGDIHFDHTLVEFGQKFCNKLWNASRLVHANLDENKDCLRLDQISAQKLELSDRWILSRLQHAIGDIRQGFRHFRFNDSAKSLYSFVWSEFCDWYLELVKIRLYEKKDAQAKITAQSVVLFVLEQILKLAHPFIPFITEEIWQALPFLRSPAESVQSIMKQTYPQVHREWIDKAAEKEMDFIQKTISCIRNIRSEMNIPPDKKAHVMVNGPKEKVQSIKRVSVYFEKLAGVQSIEFNKQVEKPNETACGIVEDVEVFIPLAGLIDLDVERDRIGKEVKRMEKILNDLNLKLSNHQFLKKAPAHIVEKEQQKQTDFGEKLKKLKKNFEMLGKA
ncbi:valine--tRNA ligase [bacterium]|nr:valine--tRNA ligase [bacterium]RQV92064.1 MAG: valine--tRNA ligase [bacterium]